MKNPLPSYSELHEAFSYDPETGVITWRIAAGNRSVGMPAGTKNDGYVKIRYKRREYLANRIAWVMWYGIDPGHYDVDHKNRVRDDNRLANLRLATKNQSQHNKSAQKSKTGVKGVSPNGRGFRVWVGLNGVKKYFGTYQTLEEAEQVAIQARNDLHKDFASHD